MNWISVKDKLPKPGDRYLILLEHRNNDQKPFQSVDVARYCCIKNWMLNEELLRSPITSKVIAWQDLPAVELGVGKL